jgi:hypothetical protein
VTTTSDELILNGDEMAAALGPLLVWIVEMQGHNQMPEPFVRLFNAASKWQTERKRDQCFWCLANPAKGFARIGDRPYCHEGTSPTCYELAQR